MKAEIIKLRKETLPSGKIGQIMDRDDFIRLIYKYKLTLMTFKEMGLSRGIWDNTLSFYGWGVNDIESIRLKPYSESTHLSAYEGFSTIIPIKDLRPSLRRKEGGIQYMVDYLERYFPGFKEIYSNYHNDPENVNQRLIEIVRELMDLQLVARYVNRRVIKWAKKKKKPYKNIIISKLEHHFAKILDELKIEYIPQFSLQSYHYDFHLTLHNLVIEVDGRGHRGKNDEIKEYLLKEKHIGLLRINIKGIFELKQNYETIKDNISKRIGIS